MPDYAANRSLSRGDAAFVQAIQQRLPAGSAVLELPMIPYPEWYAPPGTADYLLLRPYLHSTSLRWSYGLIKGREPGWMAYIASRPNDPPVELAAAAGYRGIVVARPLLVDAGAQLERSLTAATGGPPLTGTAGSWAFYDLGAVAQGTPATRPPADAAEIRRAIEEPVSMAWPEGFAPVAGDVLLRVHVAAPVARLVLRNAGTAPRAVRFETWVIRNAPDASAVAIHWPDGAVERIALGPQRIRVARSLTLPPGDSSVTFETTVVTPTPTEYGPSALRVTDPWVMDDVLVRLSRGQEPAPAVR
jgi:phosphoglycerol transferase